MGKKIVMDFALKLIKTIEMEDGFPFAGIGWP